MWGCTCSTWNRCNSNINLQGHDESWQARVDIVYSCVAHGATLEIDHFAAVCSVTLSLDGSEAGDGGLIRTSLFLLCKSSCCYANWSDLHEKSREL